MSLVSERFDGARVDPLLDAPSPPSWLAPLLNEAWSRAMLLDLCAAHPNSLLLKYAAEQLLHGAHAAEVAAHPALAAIGGSLSLASFSGFLSTQLGALQAEGGGGGAPADAFGRLATSGEAQLLTALLLLEAAPWADGSAARRAAGAHARRWSRRRRPRTARRRGGSRSSPAACRATRR